MTVHSRGISHGDLRAVCSVFLYVLWLIRTLTQHNICQANILITNDHVDDLGCYAVLNDFGMADYAESSTSQEYLSQDLIYRDMELQERWTAPELLNDQAGTGKKRRISKAGDVYAFGIVFLEVCPATFSRKQDYNQ